MSRHYICKTVKKYLGQEARQIEITSLSPPAIQIIWLLAQTVYFPF